MSEQSPYEVLGITEDASFDEVQDARARLAEQYSGDRKRLEMIETAYDSILMDRLRLRQEGKIKVPERIRFPERIAQQVPQSFVPAPAKGGRAWLQRLLDTPSRSDILWPAGVFVGLSALSLYPGANNSVLQFALALGVGTCLYFINRKENKFGRAVLLTVTGLIGGLALGGMLSSVVTVPWIAADQLISWVTFLVLWLVSSFLR